MARITTTINTPIQIDPHFDYPDNGWIVSNGNAVHDSVNSGNLVYGNIMPQEDVKYIVRYNVSQMGSGSLQVSIGGVTGPQILVGGSYVHEFTAINNEKLKIWSDADLVVSDLIITTADVTYNTIVFNNDGNSWVGYVSYTADTLFKFIDDFYTFKNGVLWKHNENDKRNNFYGEQYPSIIEFVLNIQPAAVKNLHSIRIVGNKPWGIDVTIPPREGKSKGQKSRIKRGNFKNLQGQFFADFLKDMTDPRFESELKALMNGADLQGQVAIIRMEINEEDEVRLLSVDTEISDSQYSY